MNIRRTGGGIAGRHSAAEGVPANDRPVLGKKAIRNMMREKHPEARLAAIDRQFLNLDEREKNARAVLAKLETKLVRHLLEFRHE